MIQRRAAPTLKELALGFPIVAVTGPRQSGKTTLVRESFSDKPYVSLEDPDVLMRAEDDPRGFLARFPEGAILDEAQRCPVLFSYLQGVVDAKGQMGQWILTGSQQFGLLTGITQSLAGRVGFLHLLPFALRELLDSDAAPESVDELLFQGLYPPIYDRGIAPSLWLSNYNKTYLERDVRNLINIRDLSAFQRFMRLCAAASGQVLNLSAMGTACGITHNTAKAWLSVLEASFIVTLIPPYFKNYRKRLVKRPKLYFLDVGLCAWLLGIRTLDHLSIHSARGALFETWVVGECLKNAWNQGQDGALYYWRTQGGDKVDLILDEGASLRAVEIKSGATYRRDHLKGLKKLRDIAGEEVSDSYLIVGGEVEGTVDGIHLVGWQDLSSLLGS